MTQGFYELLGVSAQASYEEIRAAYRAQVGTLMKRRKALVEQGGDTSQIDLVRGQLDESWAVLADVKRRRRYDAMVVLSGQVTDADSLWARASGAWVPPASALAVDLIRAISSLQVGELPSSPRPREALGRRLPVPDDEDRTAPGTSPTAVPLGDDPPPRRAISPEPPARPSAPALRAEAPRATAPRPSPKVAEATDPSVPGFAGRKAPAAPPPPPRGEDDSWHDEVAERFWGDIKGKAAASAARPAKPAATPPGAMLRAGTPTGAPKAGPPKISLTPPAPAAAPAPAATKSRPPLPRPAATPSRPPQKAISREDVARYVEQFGYSGEMLRAVREARELSIEQMADYTRISAKYLEAIEGDAYGSLPSATFVRGYVKEMARLLQLDEPAVVSGYMRRLEGA